LCHLLLRAVDIVRALCIRIPDVLEKKSN